MLFGAVFGLGGLLCGWLAAGELLVVSSLQRGGVAAQGEVFDYVYQSGGSRRRYSGGGHVPLIRFVTAGGQQVTVRVNAANIQFLRGNYPLLYLPQDPQTARIDSFATMWMWSAILSACAAMLLPIGLSMLSQGVRGSR